MFLFQRIKTDDKDLPQWTQFRQYNILKNHEKVDLTSENHYFSTPLVLLPLYVLQSY